MSVEEFAAREVADAEERSKRAAAAAAGADGKPMSMATLMELGLEDDAAEVAKATLKDRKWDDWKDGVQKGMGNTKRY